MASQGFKALLRITRQGCCYDLRQIVASSCMEKHGREKPVNWCRNLSSCYEKTHQIIYFVKKNNPSLARLYAERIKRRLKETLLSNHSSVNRKQNVERIKRRLKETLLSNHSSVNRKQNVERIKRRLKETFLSNYYSVNRKQNNF